MFDKAPVTRLETIYRSFDFHFIKCKWIMIFLLVYKWNVYYKLAKPTALVVFFKSYEW